MDHPIVPNDHDRSRHVYANDARVAAHVVAVSSGVPGKLSDLNVGSIKRVLRVRCWRGSNHAISVFSLPKVERSSSVGSTAILRLGSQRSFHFCDGPNMSPTLWITGVWKNRVQALPQRLLELASVVAPRMRHYKLSINCILDPLDSIIVQYARFDELGTDLKKADGRSLSAEPYELERLMKFPRLSSTIFIQLASPRDGA